MKKSKTVQLALMAVALWLAGGVGAAEVKNVTAAYAWPWRAEIRFEVAGDLPTSSWLVVSVTDRANNKTYTAATNVLSGDTGLNQGVHHVIWELDKQGVTLQSTNAVFTVRYDKPALYCVVDLSGGKDATSYPVTYMDTPPSEGFNTDTYKTTKLVLRWIEAGTFMMGSPSGESGRDDDESQHKVTLTKQFYIGLFEVTQMQWTLVTGSNPSYWARGGDKRPVERVSYDMIRGSSAGTNWPASDAVDAGSFLGKLRAKTGLTFDLPTEAQWEYACRAGTTTAYSYGGSANGDYMWYDSSWDSSSQTQDVGTKKANPWGLYDMHGNVDEWCLDWYSSNLGTAAVTDPKGASFASQGDDASRRRVERGGSTGAGAKFCRSASRMPGGYPSSSFEHLGFRLVRMPLSEEER